MISEFFCYPFGILLHSVDLECVLALLVSSVVLVNKTLSNSLVHLLNNCLVCNKSIFLVSAFNSCVELLNNSTELSLEHFVLKSLNGNNFYTLFCGFNVRHFLSPLSIFYGMITETIRLCLRGYTNTDNIIHYGIVSRFSVNFKRFSKKILKNTINFQSFFLQKFI